MSWGYEKEKGPSTWKDLFPVAEGARQSPIDIETASAAFDKALTDKPLTIKYEKESDMEVSNTGHSVKAQIKNETSGISGGPLDGVYRLEQFHLHWGAKNESGSEHTIDKQEFASELHLVHWNTKYSSFGEAADRHDGLAVIGIMLNVGNKHAKFADFTDMLKTVKGPGKKEKCPKDFNPTGLLPGTYDKYWTYEGSLTTPPLYESVQWIVLKDTISVSQDQMEALRSLAFDDKGIHKMVDNFRPPQPLNGRKVSASFQE